MKRKSVLPEVVIATDRSKRLREVLETSVASLRFDRDHGPLGWVGDGKRSFT